jgi:H+/Cl- antiporter ClcA
MFFAALAGGATFATKWLYHSVAKGEWNRDRILWRFIAPINSAVLATAAGFGISAGIMPFLDQNSFDNLYAALFFGFFIGHFSDHVLAALQRLAKKWFGTVDNRPD